VTNKGKYCINIQWRHKLDAKIFSSFWSLHKHRHI